MRKSWSKSYELRQHHRARTVSTAGGLPSRGLVPSRKVLGEQFCRGDRIPRFARSGAGRGARTAGRLHVPRLQLAQRLASREGHLPHHRRRP